MIYFAYGSNMDHDQMQARCPGHKVIGVGRLSHYTLAFTRWSRSWNSGTADILPEQGKEICGVLFDLTLDDLKRMDKFADYPNSYVRQDVMVERPGAQQGERLPALTYVAIRQGAFLPSKAYLSKMIQGAEKNQLSAQYIQFLKSLRTHD
ncbi:MAG: gamma-glutamylcyclotransferase [Nitrospirae bacterium]|nr:gamma-glutamylcyclotransferase [Candidatus Manganitrophaceae bacterium]